MSKSETATDPSFNAWTDPWLPLVQESGATVWASPVQVLCGEKDGVDLDYPRDDFRVYARLLLSALVQALFPAKNNVELTERLEKPLSRPVVEKRLKPVKGDFELFGPTPFLQVTAPAKPPDKGAAAFVFVGEDLYQPCIPIESISHPVALVALFVEQAYAGGAGRGYGAGPGGQPGAFTLIDAGTVRRSAWANTLAADVVKRNYAADDERPWSNEKGTARPRASIGLVRGLFFQPRSIWLIPAGLGQCSFTGLEGPLVRRSPILPKSELSKKPANGEDLWQHPCAPLALNSQGIGSVRLKPERPAWTGLAQLLRPLSKESTRKKHEREGPALVLQQWRAMGLKSARTRLLVLDFDRDKANVKRRFFEAYPLTSQLLTDPAIDQLRAAIDHTQDVRHHLVTALKNAHDGRKLGGMALADAESAFWSESERPFLDWLSQVVAVQVWSDEVEERVGTGRRTLDAALRRTALELFDAHVSISEFDPRKQERVAMARRRLRQILSGERPAAAKTQVPQEVKP